MAQQIIMQAIKKVTKLVKMLFKVNKRNRFRVKREFACFCKIFCYNFCCPTGQWLMY